MARPKGDPSELVRRLDAALKVAKRTDVVSADTMAEIAGMTWRNLLVTHIEPDPKFPIQRRGAEGVAWEFRVQKVLRHMLVRARERIAASDTRARKLLRLTGFSVPESENGTIDLPDLSKLVDVNMRAQKAKVEQRLYVPAETVRFFITGYNRRLRDTLLGERQKVDPVGSLPAEIAEEIDDDMRNLAVALQEEADRFLEEWCAAVEPGGTA